jgi:hypothetical protein
MPVSAGRGPLSKAIRDLCRELDRGAITKEEFKVKLGRLIRSQYSYLGGVVFQDVGLALDYWIRVRHPDRAEEYWQLADQTDVKIRKAFEHWQHAMSK